jgi:hypothetical protein
LFTLNASILHLAAEWFSVIGIILPQGRCPSPLGSTWQTQLSFTLCLLAGTPVIVTFLMLKMQVLMINITIESIIIAMPVP